MVLIHHLTCSSIGTSHAKLVKEAGELKDGVVKLISGGPMMGRQCLV